jgi:hypothetical protein
MVYEYVYPSNIHHYNFGGLLQPNQIMLPIPEGISEYESDVETPMVKKIKKEIKDFLPPPKYLLCESENEL